MFLQLLKTTPYLSGQCKLDVELDRICGETVTRDCHLSPLSPCIPYTDSRERKFFNYEYSENLKYLYRDIHDSFFKDVPQFYSTKALYKDRYFDAADHTCQSGARRMRYSLYGKQFSFLVPVWIEDAEDIERLNFELTVKPAGSDSVTASSRFYLGSDLRSSLKTYLSGLTSDLLRIDLESEKAYVTGIHAETGTVITKDVSYIVSNLLDRERTVLETDSILASILSENCIVARQLINFNFCFNIDDLVGPGIAEETESEMWTFEIDTYLEDTLQEKKDIYTNYEFIPSYVSDITGGHFDSSRNALTYLKDSEYTENILMNKVTQPCVHWSLRDNPEYMFNLYAGTGSVNDNGSLNTSVMFGQPNVMTSEYSIQDNNIHWCKMLDFRNTSNLEASLMHINDIERFYTNFYASNGSVTWVNGIKYDFTDCDLDSEIDFWMVICLVQYGTLYPRTEDQITSPEIYAVPELTDTYALFVPYTDENGNMNRQVLDSVTAASVSQNRIAYGTHPDSMRIAFSLYDFMRHIVKPTRIEFVRGIAPVRAEAPSNECTEIKYVKKDINHYSYIYRYSGNLTPMFVSSDERVFKNFDYWYKTFDSEDIWSEEMRKYNRFLNTEYEAVYPSVGYFPLNSETSRYTVPERYDDIHEVTWYNSGRLYSLPETVTASFTTASDYEIEEAYVYSYLCDALGISPVEFDDEIRALYKFEDDYDYVSLTDIRFMNHRITFKLR